MDYKFKIKSRYGELNPRPLPYQGSALPLSYNGINPVGSFQSAVGS